MKKSVIWTALSFVLIIMSVSGQTDIPTCPLEYPQEFYKNPGSVLKVPQNTERIIRVDEVLASSEAQSFVIYCDSISQHLRLSTYYYRGRQ